MKTLLLAVALLLLGGAPLAARSGPEQTASPRPAIWLLEDADTRIWLFGTVHVLTPGLRWRSPAFDRVAQEADELVLEIADDASPADMSRFGRYLLLGKTVSILSRVSPQRRPALQRIIEGSGLPIENLDAMQTWAVAIMLTAQQMDQAYRAAGRRPGPAPTETEPSPPLTGVEDALRVEFRANGRPISGVETGEQQLSFLASAPVGVQRTMLESLVDGDALGTGQFEPNEAGWLSGDIDSIAAELEQLPAELRETLIARRNAAWADWLVARLDRPGDVLFAVGVGHLAGDGSVQALLAARGLTVRRID
jgi:uncharacterized protein